jgi:hypothetical protein
MQFDQRSWESNEQLGRPHHMKFTANPPRMASLTGASLR